MYYVDSFFFLHIFYFTLFDASTSCCTYTILNFIIILHDYLYVLSFVLLNVSFCYHTFYIWLAGDPEKVPQLYLNIFHFLIMCFCCLSGSVIVNFSAVIPSY